MEVQAIKSFLKSNKITYEQLSEKSGIPLNTLKNIFSGRTPNPRIDTIQAIMRALELEQSKTQVETEDHLFSLIRQLNEQEKNELENYINFLLSKRKKP